MSPLPPRSRPSRRSLLGHLGAAASIGLAGCANVPSGFDADGTTGSTSTSGDGTTTGGGAVTAPDSLADLAPPARFDFWPGTWGWGAAASTTVYALLSGTLLVEDTTDSDGPAGMAMTFFDRAAGAWQRREVDATGRVARLSGGFDDAADAMRLTGTQSAADGSRIDVRATYALDADGTVAYRRETGGDGAWTVAAEHSFESTGNAIERAVPTATPVAGSEADVASRPPARRFDFWVGTWDVYNQSDSVVGESVVESRLDGALLVENWQGRSGSAGHSFNYYDHAEDAWTQTWVAADARWLELSGGFSQGSMRLEGTQYGSDGSSQGYRGEWSPHPDGTVRQDLYTAADETPWELAFTGDYRPVE